MSGTRILRKEEWSFGEEIILPCGIMADNGCYRNIVITEMNGVDEENIANKQVGRNGAKALTVLFRRAVQAIPGLIEPKKNPDTMLAAGLFLKSICIPDRDFLLLSILGLENPEAEISRRFVCPECEEPVIHDFRLKDLRVYDWPEDTAWEVSGILPHGYRDKIGVTHKEVVYSFPTGWTQEKIIEQARNNEGKAASLLHANCLKKLGNVPAIDTHITRRMVRKDRRYLQELAQEKFPGVDKRARIECPGCGNEFDVEVDFSGFFS